MYSELSGTIQNIDYPKADTIDFKLLYIEDSSDTDFRIENTGSGRLTIGQKLPSYYFGETPEKHQWEEFSTEFVGGTTLGPGESIDMRVKYTADPNLIEYPPGSKALRIIFGLYDPDGPEPVTDSDLIVCDTFTVLATKTVKLIDAYKKRIDFGNVYVNPVVRPEQNWDIKNFSETVLSIDSQQLIPITPMVTEPEFEVGSIFIGEPLNPGQSIQWPLSYAPLDRGYDSSKLSLFYRPFPVQFPDSVDSASAILVGRGIQQELTLAEMDVPVDTLYFGDTTRICFNVGSLRVGRSKIFSGIIVNNGNIPFGVIGRNLEGYLSADLPEGFTVADPVLSDGRILGISEKDTFSLSFEPGRIGIFRAKYVLRSDIVNRNVFGVPSDVKNYALYFFGTGTAPDLVFGADTIDFGNVVLNPPFCLPGRDTVIEVFNRGNETLEIRSINMEPAGSYFSFAIDTMIIAPNSGTSMTISYQAEDIGPAAAILTFDTNEDRSPMPEMIIKAEGTRAEEALLSIPDRSSRPGRTISVPILINKNSVVRAKNFSDTITFDSSLLEFLDAIPNRTASESAVTTAFAVDPGRLYLAMRMPAGRYFQSSDTLTLLSFRTYLGERVSWPVAFSSPSFGDGKCSQVLNLSLRNGIFSLDSVCGLDLKAHPHPGEVYAFGPINPNPAGSILTMNYKLPFKTDIQIKLYNNYGECVKTFVNAVLPSGEYEFETNVTNLPPGTYFCTMRSGLFHKTRAIVISR